MDIRYSRGSIWWTNLEGLVNSSVQIGYRPVVIVSSLIGNVTNDTVLVVPITSKFKDLSVNAQLSFVIKNNSNGTPVQNTALCNQVRVVPRNSLITYIGQASTSDMELISNCLMIALGIAKDAGAKFKSSQEALAQQRKDREALESLIPQAENLINKLQELVNRQGNKKISNNKLNQIRIRRTEEEIKDFLKEWMDPYNNRNEVAAAFKFNSYNSAYQFYKSKKDKYKEITNG